MCLSICARKCIWCQFPVIHRASGIDVSVTVSVSIAVSVSILVSVYLLSVFARPHNAEDTPGIRQSG